jgi:hypothetical protein
MIDNIRHLIPNRKIRSKLTNLALFYAWRIPTSFLIVTIALQMKSPHFTAGARHWGSLPQLMIATCRFFVMLGTPSLPKNG